MERKVKYAVQGQRTQYGAGIKYSFRNLTNGGRTQNGYIFETKGSILSRRMYRFLHEKI
ncbi:outer membrane insertion signal domain protein [Prevotella disiens JCM 6334 = ATCC 29426]|uniref:Outer membrane insertion signal domain protein n=2 Tax=Prevotella disiens TaxID=28130 RepID=E1KQV7_9BACT|nr:hypothetical protein [Prevotella disiens]EFL46135.1 outer membrane insertion signal domain protein [Prevotella disiens FB035-09AN]ERJ79336.1 outer membrane insertion signal domain protein [Prevotella disiens JCM 6334 = ATCC 29426]